MRDLTVVMPVFNEEKRVGEAVHRVLDLSSLTQLIIVDDGSTDGTANVLRSISDPRITVLTQASNLGKGAALRRGFACAVADFVAVHDADLEYDPKDLERMLVPLRDGRADVVFGSRFMGSAEHRVLYFWHSVGNRLLTLLSNMFTNINLTDMETCSKVFRRQVIQGIDLREDRFGFEPEVTAKIAREDYRIYEIGISYSGRTYAEGKKINWKDGLRAIFVIVKYGVIGPRGRRTSPAN